MRRPARALGRRRRERDPCSHRRQRQQPPPRHRPRGRPAARRQAPAGHRRPAGPGAVRPDHRPSTGFLVIRGTAALARRPSPCTGSRTWRSTTRRSTRITPSSWSFLRACVTTSAMSCPPSASPTCTCAPLRSGRRSRSATVPMLPRDVREDTPALVHRLKLHPAMLVALERQVQRVQDRARRRRSSTTGPAPSVRPPSSKRCSATSPPMPSRPTS